MSGKGGQEMAVPVVESAAGGDAEWPSYYEGVTDVRVNPRFEALAPRSLIRVSVRGSKNRFCVPMTDLDTSTPLGRAFATQSSGFPGENFFEKD